MATWKERRAALRAAVPLDPFVREDGFLLLEEKGGDLQGTCPFHDNDRPTFYVVSSRGFFHCFDCGAHGDVVEYQAKRAGMTDEEAIEHLERRVMDGDEPIKYVGGE